MNYLRLFETGAEYTAKEETLLEPSVSFVLDQDKVFFKDGLEDEYVDPDL